MKTRQTSIEAYEEIKRNGLLSKQRLRVYSWLYKHGPATAGEVTKALKSDDEVHPSYHRRLDELGELGCAARIQVRPCGVTGLNVYEWDVTAHLPNGKITHKGGLKSRIEALEARVAALVAAL